MYLNIKHVYCQYYYYIVSIIIIIIWPTSTESVGTKTLRIIIIRIT